MQTSEHCLGAWHLPPRHSRLFSERQPKKERAMLSRTRVVSVAIIIAVFVSGDLLYAQRSRGGRSGPGGFGMGPGGPPGMGGAVMLAGNPAVQKEIDLDRDGAEKVGKLTESYMQEAQ